MSSYSVNVCTRPVSGVPSKGPGSSNLQTNGAAKAEGDPPNYFGIHRRKGVDPTAGYGSISSIPDSGNRLASTGFGPRNLLRARCISCNVYIRLDELKGGPGSMLAFLDSLCAALLARDSTEIQRLLALPAARDLPRRVREEAIAISRAGNRSFMAPIHALHFYYKLTHMVDESSDPIFGDSAKQGEAEGGQIELPLRKVGNGGR